jgi:hypothetical protein
MVPAQFRSTRLKWGYLFFPPTILVTEQEVIRSRRILFITRKSSIRIQDIASMHMKNHKFSSEILIKRLRGGPPMVLEAVRRPDAHRIRELVEKILGV